jgi:hypothetical protein
MSKHATGSPFIGWMLLIAAWCLSPLIQADPTFVNAADPRLPTMARGVPMGGALQVVGLDLNQVGPTDLDLERFEVFDKRAELWVDNEHSNRSDPPGHPG